MTLPSVEARGRWRERGRMGERRATRAWGVGHQRLRKTVRATMSTTITAITSSTSLVNVMPAL